METEDYTLVARKPCFDLPTACPVCLPAFFYLKLAGVPFRMDFNSMYPDSDSIPYVEYGLNVAYNNENGGVIERLKEDGVVDLDVGLSSLPDWVSTKAMLASWLTDAIMYELWLGSDGTSASKIYYSDLPWPIGKVLFVKQVYFVKQRLGIDKGNADKVEETVRLFFESLGITKRKSIPAGPRFTVVDYLAALLIYKNASLAYGALSTRLDEQKFLFEDRPSSLDAIFLSHVLFTLQALPETSVIRTKLLEHSNIVRYAEKLRLELNEVGSSSSLPRSQFHSFSSSSTSRKGSSNWSSKTNNRQKKEKTEEEKIFKKRAKYFLAAQLVSVLLFLSIMGRTDASEVELDDDDDDAFSYD